LSEKITSINSGSTVQWFNYSLIYYIKSTLYAPDVLGNLKAVRQQPSPPADLWNKYQYWKMKGNIPNGNSKN
jgi:hypothetical protein